MGRVQNPQEADLVGWAMGMLRQAARKSSEALHPVFSVYTTSAPEQRKTILGTFYGVLKNVIGTIFCIPLPVKPDDCTMG